MRWVEISIKTSHEAVDFLTVIFEDLGAMGVVVEDPQLLNDYIDSGLWDYTDLTRNEKTDVVEVKAYLPEDEELESKLITLNQEFDKLRENVDVAPGEITRTIIQDEDWVNNWKQYFHVSRIGKRIVIRPSWEDYVAEPDDVVITLDPGAAFGTGTHPTTAMCLAELEEQIRPGMTVFDVGTGSGVLAVAAVKLGAAKVTAVDYDATAVKAAAENLAMNSLEDKIDLHRSDLMKNVDGKADVITANIIADIIMRLFDELDQHLASDGKLIASGIIEPREAEVVAAAEAHDFVIEKINRQKEWVMLLISRGEKK